MSAFPPHRLGASMPVTQEIALKFLSKYLESAKTSPHLLPNARLDPSGPTAGSSNSSITIHNLQRVEAGLKGEWLAPTLELNENNVPVAEGMDDGVNQGQGAAEGGEGEGWMDLDDYQREQSIEGGDIVDDVHAANAETADSDLEVHKSAGGNEEEHVATIKPKTNGVKTTTTKTMDKAAKKEAKKAKLKQEQREKAERIRKLAEKQKAADS